VKSETRTTRTRLYSLFIHIFTFSAGDEKVKEQKKGRNNYSCKYLPLGISLSKFPKKTLTS
jgi:hypothetical protein